MMCTESDGYLSLELSWETASKQWLVHCDEIENEEIVE